MEGDMSGEVNVNIKEPGISFLMLLCLLFVGLKLGGIITWSWWWVLAPLWIPTLFALALLVLMLGFFIVANR